MNILFGALLLALLLLPGFIFRMGYLAKPFASKSFNSSFVEELLFSLLPAFILQVGGYAIVETWRSVDEKRFYLLLINSDKAASLPISKTDILQFSVYLLLVSTCALVLGFCLRLAALRTRLHLRYSLFRIYNEWQVFFDGIILDYPGKSGNWKAVSESWLDVLVENKHGALIYSGFLEDYVLGKDDTLSRIYLSAVRRRRLEDDIPQAQAPELAGPENDVVDYNEPDTIADEETEKMDARYYFMPGNYFMIPGSEIKSINITYYTSDE